MKRGFEELLLQGIDKICYFILETINIFTALARNRQDINTLFTEQIAALYPFRPGKQINLVEQIHMPSLHELRIIGGKLLLQGCKISKGIFFITRSIKDKDQHAGPFNVSKKGIAQAHAFTGPFDNPRDIGNDDGPVVLNLKNA
jgi:hypothetical protein